MINFVRIRALISLPLLIIGTAAYAQASDGLVAKYSFENNLNDSSGNSRTGTGNALTYGVGKIGRAAVFNGTTSNMKVDSLAGVLPSANTPRSLTFWMYREPTQSGLGNMISWGASNESRARFSIAVQSDGKLYFVGENNDVDLGYSVVPPQTWTHVAITYANQTIKSYINGVLNGPPVTINTFNTSPAFGLILGEGPPNRRTGQEYFLGKLDEIGIYDRELNASEVQSISAATSNAPAGNSGITSVPTLSSWALGVLAMFLAGAALLAKRKIMR